MQYLTLIVPFFGIYSHKLAKRTLVVLHLGISEGRSMLSEHTSADKSHGQGEPHSSWPSPFPVMDMLHFALVIPYWSHHVPLSKYIFFLFCHWVPFAFLPLSPLGQLCGPLLHLTLIQYHLPFSLMFCLLLENSSHYWHLYLFTANCKDLSQATKWSIREMQWKATTETLKTKFSRVRGEGQFKIHFF